MSTVFPINANDRVARYTATAGQTAFAIDFPFQAASDITLTRTRAGATVTLAQPADYTVTGAGTSGGTATLSAASLAGDIITVIGDADLTRTTDIVRAGRFNSAAIDSDLDRLTLQAQELRRDVDRAVKADFGSAGAALPTAEAGKALVWDASGKLVNAALDEGDIAASVAAAAASATAAATSAASVTGQVAAAQAARTGAETAETAAEKTASLHCSAGQDHPATSTLVRFTSPQNQNRCVAT